jgi:AraC-like DNA-binding protein
MRARFARHRFGRHSHDTYAIGMLEAGHEEIDFPGGVEHVGAGDLVLIEPGVVHTGQAGTGGWWAYRAFYPNIELVTAVADDIGAFGGLPYFERRVVADARAARWLAAAHRAAESGQSAVSGDSLAADSRLCAVLAFVLRAYGSHGRQRPMKTAGRPTMAQARDLLHASILDPPNLGELAAVAGLTPFALLRAFRTAYGLPPHAYLIQLRIRRACELLRRGMKPAEVAAAVGFCDQSHLSRHFRRLVGVPPGAYQRGVQ